MDPSPRAKLRAALLAVVIGVHGWLAFPLPPRVEPAKLEEPRTLEELERWRAFLGDLGVSLTTQELGAAVVTATGATADLRRITTRPFNAVLRLTGTGQSWALFAAPDTHPARLELHARIAGRWQPVYRRLDPEHPFLARQLGYRRVRGVHDATGGGAYPQLADWAAQQVFVAYPEADAARLRLVQTHSTRPGAPDDASTRAKRAIVVERAP